MAAQSPVPTDDTRVFNLSLDETLLRNEMREMLDSWEQREWGSNTLLNVIGYFHHTLDYVDKFLAPIVLGK